MYTCYNFYFQSARDPELDSNFVLVKSANIMESNQEEFIYSLFSRNLIMILSRCSNNWGEFCRTR